MIKGWKNNPEWVRYYENRDKERYERILQMARLEACMAQFKQKTEPTGLQFNGVDLRK